VAQKEKILVVRVGLGGDLVMVTPALKAMLAAFPDAEFHLLTTGEGRRVLSGFSDRITQTFLYHRRFFTTQLLQYKLKKSLKLAGYTRIYVFETRSFYRSWLQDLAPNFYSLDNHTTLGHYCEKCLEMVAGSLAPADAGLMPRPWISLPVTEAGLNKAKAQLLENGLDQSTKLVGFHPTFSGSSLSIFRDRKGIKHRTWPRENFAALAKLLQAQAKQKGISLAVVIDALPEERPLIEPLLAESEGSIILMTSPPDFQRFKGYLQLLDVLVSPNTGPMHFAAALGTHVVSLFSQWAVDDCGPFVPAERFEVLEARHTSQPGLGLAAIDPQKVADAVWRIIP